MRLMPISIRNIFPAALAFGLGITAVYADGPIRPGKKIQFSDPDGGAESNLFRANPEQSSTFKQIKDDIFRPLQGFTPENPLDPVTALPPPPNPGPQPVSKHTRQLLEQRKNWAFMNMEDMAGNSTAEEMIGVNQVGPDGREKPNVNPIDKFYLDLDKSHTLTARQMSEALGTMQSQGVTGTNTFNPMSFAFAGTNQSVVDSFSKPAHLGTGDDDDKPLLSFGQSPGVKPTTEEIDDQNRRFQQFQQVLDPHLANQPLTTGVDANGFPVPGLVHGRQPSSLFESRPAPATPLAAHPSAASYASPQDPTLAALHSRVYDNPTARALGVTNSFVTTRTTDQPKTEYQNPFDPFNKTFKTKF